MTVKIKDIEVTVPDSMLQQFVGKGNKISVSKGRIEVVAK